MPSLAVTGVCKQRQYADADTSLITSALRVCARLRVPDPNTLFPMLKVKTQPPSLWYSESSILRVIVSETQAVKYRNFRHDNLHNITSLEPSRRYCQARNIP